MAVKQIDYQVDIPVEVVGKGEPQIKKPLEKPKKQDPPLTFLLHQAKLRMIHTTNSIMQEYGIPAAMMEGIISGVLADIRAQASADLLIDFQNQLISQKEGEKIE